MVGGLDGAGGAKQNVNGDELAGGDGGEEELKDEGDNYYRNIF